ncbi:MAG: DUF3500 domain-containing protein [Chloroflexi bacterium]|nr:DUF3500 domain-containing protein [Chloroflexota bacterium]
MATDLTTAYRAPITARRMATAAAEFLGALSDRERAVAAFPFDGDERYEWHYTPVPRNGLLLEQMGPEQRRAALALLETGVSARGATEAREIIALEAILRETERIEGRASRWDRNPELYYFSVFGEPSGSAPWAWRVGGHHIGLHFTLVDGDMVAPTPLFFGADPANVLHGPETGRRTLAAEEDMARALLGSLDPSQKGVAIVDSHAPADILTKNYRRVDADATPQGLAYAAMSGEQRGRLVDLVRHYVERAADEIAAQEWSKIEQAGLDEVTFAWAGPEEPRQGHYYAVRGRTFLLEYDNTQHDANHIHSVWRDFAGDWGEDLLAHHYAASHHR